MKSKKQILTDKINKYNSQLTTLLNRKMDKTFNIGAIHTYETILFILRKKLEQINN